MRAFGAAQIRQILKDPECIAHRIWAEPNDQTDDVYFGYTIGEKLAVELGSG